MTGATQSTVTPEDTQDHWLDRVSGLDRQRHRHPLFAFVQDTFGQPLNWMRRTFGFLRTSPGKMTAMTLIITVAIFAAGFSMSQSSAARKEALGTLITTTEPTSYAAHNLYTSLSVADTTATTGFAQAGVESPQTRQTYNDSVRRASIAASRAAAGVADLDSRSGQLISRIQRQLPVYTGLVETARTNNRVGNPVGAAYLAEASALMRTEILPAAAELFELTSEEVRQQQSRLTQPQWIPLSGLAAAILLLLLGQRWLAVRTRRWLNKGFVTATVLMTTALLWVGGANLVTWNAGTRGFEEASRPLESLTTARIAAQKARTEETLALVRRQTTGGETGFTSATRTIEQALDTYEDSVLSETDVNSANADIARQSLVYWRAAHSTLIDDQAGGNYPEALETALGVRGVERSPGDGTAASAFDSLDSALSSLIDDARASLRSYIADGLKATTLVSSMVLLLSLAAMAATVAGIRPRLQEYL
ncbi:hypothetical protein [Corynebacterium pygosceleis]|uniref:Phenol hydroxylase n=1 Tax=Corynebacterium pygosceleis TaxID=2800406 RepID=A0A9Q4GKC0_9CORY|nr:hypothetical protein [Corynebacterium pygosceleis]MCK7638361.1 hypothetical protein [Corynebacterium pygosceleis]MCK7675341.1 hypothetical protein [Corynebacterium pygosceleis]MCL0121265.1 hypothetical protein [Corynebacterium pygosceleis]MCX7445480.1 hypothetical protein [Corynebacterium pygosceleis]MCX7469024.1 hypothetical protein [Corynebacterium pygosceleis]